MKKEFSTMDNRELDFINGGGVGGFVVGTLIGSTVALVGTPILVATGNDEDAVQTFIYSSIVSGMAIGSMFTGPV